MMETNKLFEEILESTSEDTAKFVAKSMDIADQIVSILRNKGWTQKQLAKKLGKKESEISKWLTGTHNFTLRSISKIETIFGEDVVIVPLYWGEYSGIYSNKMLEVPEVYENISFKKSKTIMSVYYDENQLDKDTPFIGRYTTNNNNNLNDFATKNIMGANRRNMSQEEKWISDSTISIAV